MLRAGESISVREIIVALALLIVALATFAAAAGLFWQHGGNGQYATTTLRGETVDVYGRGIYQHDSVFVGAGNRGTDAVILFLGGPLLLVAAFSYRRRSLYGALLLAGALTLFLYVYASYSLGVAYNPIFLAYIALFGASLWALVFTVTSIDFDDLARRMRPGIPQRGLAIFLFASAVATLVIWLTPLVAAVATGDPPDRLDLYTTKITDTLDIGVVTPAVTIAGVLVLRGHPLGYIAAFALLTLEAALAPLIAAQTISQLWAGVDFTPPEIVGPMLGFVALAAIAVAFILALLRHIDGNGAAP